MVELEAMACGRPVIVHFTYDGAYSEPPPFVRAHSGPEIAAAVERLIADLPERERLGAAGREWVVRNHNAAQMAERVEQLAMRYSR
jgi:glycosyltransferase involved in cell wall biosynthesis